MRRVRMALACMALLAGVLSSQASGQVADATGDATAQASFLEPAWGTATETSYYVGGAAFHSAAENAWVLDDGNGAAYLSDTTAYAWAPINLPQGALITGYDFYYRDDSSSWNIQCSLREVDSTGGSSAIGPLIGGGGVGWQSATYNLSPPYWTVNNTSNSYQAVVVTGPEAFTTFLRWRGVRIRYKLQVSPAPGVATFSDVPTGHPYFRFVEALYASGITAGCGSGKFCPDTPLTRGQMAVFLSAALGLHWPN